MARLSDQQLGQIMAASSPPTLEIAQALAGEVLATRQSAVNVENQAWRRIGSRLIDMDPVLKHPITGATMCAFCRTPYTSLVHPSDLATMTFAAYVDKHLGTCHPYSEIRALMR